MSEIRQTSVRIRGARKTPGPYIKGLGKRTDDNNQLIAAHLRGSGLRGRDRNHRAEGR